MGPMWMEAKHLSGMPMMDQIWMTDPPDSSYPACIAVKSAALQSPKAEELYLRALREAVMISGQNIAKDYVLMDIAKKLAEEHPGLLDLERFENDLYGETGPSAFRHDMQKVRYNRIGRFPTLTVQLGDKPGVMITGYRPYNVLLDALRRVVPKISPSITARDPDEYRNYWTHITKRELDEIKSGVDYQKNRSQ